MYSVRPLHGERLPRSISAEEFSKNIRTWLREHKALHIRPVNSMELHGFVSMVKRPQFEKFDYIGGAAPRRNVYEDFIFTANEAPPDQPIPIHHELAQSASRPDVVVFFCEMAAQYGGETPIIDSNKLYRYVHDQFPQMERELIKRGVRYSRTLPFEDDTASPIGRSWRSTYAVDSKDALEKKLEDEGTFYQWFDDDSIRVTSPILPAFAYNKQTQQVVFFNSMVAAHFGWEDSRNDRHKAVTFGDGSAIPSDFLEAVQSYARKIAQHWQWQNGDSIWIDNNQAMHARLPFQGPRKVYASLWKNEGDIVAWNPESTELPLSVGFWKVQHTAAYVYDALEAGYRRFDLACDYGNEVTVGRELKHSFKNKICRRDDLHITSKLWNTYHLPEHVEAACRKTLSDLQLDYLDAYLIHFPISQEFVPFEERYPPEWDSSPIQHDLTQTWKAMESLVHKGLVKEIGVCNFNSALLRQLSAIATVPITYSQVEMHPHLTQEKYLQVTKSMAIRPMAFSPLGALSYVSIDMAAPEESLLHAPVIRRLAHAHAKSPAQILIRWGVQRGTIVVVKSANHLKENKDVFDFSLSNTEMDAISGLNKNRRYNDPGEFFNYPIYD